MVNHDIGEDKAAAGNPGRCYGTYSDLLKKYSENRHQVSSEGGTGERLCGTKEIISALKDIRLYSWCSSKDYIITQISELR
jgi:hypothetical protein